MKIKGRCNCLKQFPWEQSDFQALAKATFSYVFLKKKKKGGGTKTTYRPGHLHLSYIFKDSVYVDI